MILTKEIYMGQPFKRFAILAIMTFFSFSCENSTSRIEYAEEVYNLEIIDSFKIDRPNRIRILDYNGSKNEFLAFDPITNEFLLIDGSGEVLEAIGRYGEGPNEYNTSLVAASFNDDGEGYYVQSSNEFIQYNKNWEIEKRLRISPFHTIKLYSGPKYSVPYYRLERYEQPHFFANFFSGLQVHHFLAKDDYSSQKLIEHYNADKDSLEWVLPFDAEFFPLSELDQNELRPTQFFALDKMSKLLFLTFKSGKVIGVYDLANGFKLEQKINFDHQEFINSNNSRNTALLHFGNQKLGVFYYTGLSEGAEQIKKDKDPDYSSYQDPTLYRIIILKGGQQQKNEVMFPTQSEPHSEIIQMPNHRLLLRDIDKGDVEPEFSSYTIYELKIQK